jgi:hypothetical protein
MGFSIRDEADSTIPTIPSCKFIRQSKSKQNKSGKAHSNRNVYILQMRFSAYLLGFDVHLLLDDWEIKWLDMDWFHLAQNQWRYLSNIAIHFRAPYNGGNFLCG